MQPDAIGEALLQPITWLNGEDPFIFKTCLLVQLDDHLL